MSVPRQRGRRVNSAFIFFLLSLVMKHWVQNIMITWTSKGSRLPNGLFFGSTKPLYFIASLAKTAQQRVSCHVLSAHASIFFLLSLVKKHWVQNIMITWSCKGSRLPNGLFVGSTKPLYFIASLAKTAQQRVSWHLLSANARCVKNTRE